VRLSFGRDGRFKFSFLVYTISKNALMQVSRSNARDL